MSANRVNAVEKCDFSGAGVLSGRQLAALFEAGVLQAQLPLLPRQIQPASVDLRLGAVAYRVQAGFLPGRGQKVMDRVQPLCMHTIDLTQGGVLERGAVYIIPLMEQVDFSVAASSAGALCGVASPKSSTGRLDILTRLLVDGATAFDKIPAGYAGGLFVEVSPLTFSVVARAGDRLTQLRLRAGHSVVSDAELIQLDSKTPFVYLENNQPEPAVVDGGIWLSVDVLGKQAQNGTQTKDADVVIGYRARRNAPLVDLQKLNYYPVADFWEPVFKSRSGSIILNPEDFYIMASRERLVVPPQFSSEMMPYETSAGELRVHYAGFFDPGFGFGVRSDGLRGAPAVLEIRSHDVPFVLEHGQKICRMVYENLQEVPTEIYSEAIGSNYASQSLTLGKHFKQK